MCPTFGLLPQVRKKNRVTEMSSRRNTTLQCRLNEKILKIANIFKSQKSQETQRCNSVFRRFPMSRPDDNQKSTLSQHRVPAGTVCVLIDQTSVKNVSSAVEINGK